MRSFRLLLAMFALICGMLGSPAHVEARGAGIEWEILNQEVMRLHQAGQYDRAALVAKKALEVAEKTRAPTTPMWPRA